MSGLSQFCNSFCRKEHILFGRRKKDCITGLIQLICVRQPQLPFADLIGTPENPFVNIMKWNHSILAVKLDKAACEHRRNCGLIISFDRNAVWSRIHGVAQVFHCLVGHYVCELSQYQGFAHISVHKCYV